MSNYEIVVKRVKNEAKTRLIISLILTVLGVGYLVNAIYNEFLDISGAILVGFYLVLIIYAIIKSILDLRNPIRKCPDIHDMLKVLDKEDNALFENKYIAIVGNVFINKLNVSNMSYLEDIYVVYAETMMSTNRKRIDSIILLTKNQKIIMRLSSLSNNDILNLIDIIMKFCPNARYGKSKENMKYYKERKK